MKSKHIKRWIGYSVAVVIITVSALFSVGKILTPYLNEHKTMFESWASDLLNAPVSLGHISFAWHFYEPVIAFDAVTVLDKETHQPTLSIKKIKINLDVYHSLVTWKPLAEKINVSGVYFTLHELREGQFHIEGLKDLVITDDFTGASVKSEAVNWIFSISDLILQKIDIRYIPKKGEEKSITLDRLFLHNDGKHHDLEGQAILNQEIPTKFDVSLKWKGDFSSADLNLYVEGVYLPQFLKNQSWHQLQVTDGLATVQLSMNWDHQQVQKVKTHFQVYQLTLKSLLNQKAQLFSRIRGNMDWQRQGNQQVITGDDIYIDFPDHLWPVTGFSVTLLPQADESYFVQSINANFIDLTDAQQTMIASGLLPTSIETMLTALNPQGQLHALHIAAQDSWKDLTHIRFSTQFSALTNNPWKKMPGFKNVSGVLGWDGKNGNLKVDSRDAAFFLPSIFSNALTFDQIKADIDLRQEVNEAWFLNAKNLLLQNADIHLQNALTLLIPKNESPLMDLQSHFSVTQVDHLSHYLPLKSFDTDVQTWLKKAFLGGSLELGTFHAQGRWNDFPFDNKKGTLTMSGVAKNMDLNFAPGWPAIRHINGQLQFAGRDLLIQVPDAQFANLPLQQVHVIISNLVGIKPSILSLEGQIQSNLNEALHFIQESPLKDPIGKKLSPLQLTGPMTLDLQLVVPLKNPDKTKAAGNIRFANAQLNLPDWHLTVEQLTGALHFTEKTIEAKQLQGRLLDEPIEIHLSTQPSYVKANITGLLKVTGLEKWLQFSLADYASGAAQCEVELHLPHQNNQQPVELILKTDLKGAAIILPAEYGKKMSDKKNLRVDVLAAPKQPLKIKVDYAKVLRDMRIQIEKLTTGWQVDLDNENVSGQLMIPYDFAQQTVQARFNRLHLNIASTMQGSFINLQKLPAISFKGNDVSINDKNFGHINFEVIHNATGLTITDLDMNSDVLTFHATGNWQVIKNKSITHLQGNASTKKASKVLESWGFNSSNFVGGIGDVKFDLSWPDTPFHPTEKGLSGTLSLHLGEGRIVDIGDNGAKMGLGRVLSLLSLQTLPRRLSLNFSDLFEKGYSFDSMQADFTFKNGNVYTDNARLDGPVAQIDISGRIGINAKDFDIRLGVMPHATSSLPVAVSFFNPIAGAVTFAIEKLATKSVMSTITTYQYVITGPWDKPEWRESK